MGRGGGGTIMGEEGGGALTSLRPGPASLGGCAHYWQADIMSKISHSASPLYRSEPQGDSVYFHHVNHWPSPPPLPQALNRGEALSTAAMFTAGAQLHTPKGMMQV